MRARHTACRASAGLAAARGARPSAGGWRASLMAAAADLGGRVRRVVAVNAYDYPGGIQRANLLARLAAGGARQPVPGALAARLENKPILAGIMRGGLHDPRQLPGPLPRRAPPGRPPPGLPPGCH